MVLIGMDHHLLMMTTPMLLFHKQTVLFSHQLKWQNYNALYDPLSTPSDNFSENLYLDVLSKQYCIMVLIFSNADILYKGTCESRNAERK